MGGIGRNQKKAARRIFKLARVGYLTVYPETSLPGSDIYSLKKGMLMLLQRESFMLAKQNFKRAV